MDGPFVGERVRFTISQDLVDRAEKATRILGLPNINVTYGVALGLGNTW